MNNNKNGNEVTIDLGKLFKYYFKNWWKFIIGIAAAVILALLITAFLLVPQYKASVTFYVNNASSIQQVESISSSNLSTSMKLVRTYVNIINSNTVLKDVIREGELGYTPEELRKIMTAEQIEETEMFSVSILHPSAQAAAHIANTIAKVAPDSISDIVEGSSTKVIDSADIPDKPFSPSYRKNIVIGAFLGLVLVLAIQTFKYVFDMRLTEEEDISSYFSAPVLGIIPSFDMGTGRRNAKKPNRRD